MELGNFIHHVFFWLKNPDNNEERAIFEKSLKSFTDNSIYIKTKHIGVPAKTNRTVIDGSYTYSLLVTFKDEKDHDNYQKELNYKQFIKDCSGLWKRVLVYDSINTLE